MKRMLAGIIIFVWTITGSAYAHDIDRIEHMFGATNINGISGNGGLTVGLSNKGDITVLKYPSPSYYDQLNYRTSRDDNARDLPFFGAEENMGAFSGLLLHTDTGDYFTWLRDSLWNKKQYYNTDESGALVTEFERADYGLRVIQYDFVLPEQDIFIRHHEIELLPGSSVKSAELYFYENLAPCMTKLPFLPTYDWSDDSLNDFALLYYSRDDAFIHFIPEQGDLSGLKDLMQAPASQPDVDRAVENLDNTYGKGIYIAIGSNISSSGHHAGMDSVTKCPASRNPGFAYSPQDAFLDILDYSLSGSPVSLCQANGALIFPLDFNTSGRAGVTIYFGISDMASQSLALLRDARTKPWTTHLNESDGWWNRWLENASLPGTDDAEVIAFSKRTLITIKQSTDRDSGAIVASVSVQPPYGEDWPRDGAFINLALDIAGYHDMVTQHNIFYADVQRKEPGIDTYGLYADAPAGSFAMNYYADGMPGGPIDFEIDETGLALWTMVAHAKFLEENSEKCRYFDKVYPAVKLAADALTECKDPANDLQCLAYEDDNYIMTQGLQGAITSYIGLVAAVEAGRALGEDESALGAWQQRADELREAILSNFYKQETQNFEGSDDGARSWLLWPANFISPSAPTLESEAQSLYDKIPPHLRKETEGAAYLGKLTLALALVWKAKPDRFQALEEVILPLLKDVPTEGTHHVGEVFVTLDLLPEGAPDSIKDTFDARVAVPHVWEASLNYLSAMALYNPEAFNLLNQELPLLSCSVKEKGCGCGIRSITNFSPGGLLLSVSCLLILLGMKRGLRRD